MAVGLPRRYGRGVRVKTSRGTGSQRLHFVQKTMNESKWDGPLTAFALGFFLVLLFSDILRALMG